MFLTRDDLLALQKDEWVAQATQYMVSLGVYSTLEHTAAYMLAESLWHTSDNDGSSCDVTPQEAVEEELSHWGD